MTQQKEHVTQLGALPPRHIFILNPYTDARFTRCPICDNKTKQRKFALLIHVEPQNPVVMGKTCRYCPACDLIIAHKDEVDAQLAGLFRQRNPALVGNDYMVLGTVEREIWREGLKHPKTIAEMLEHLHDFKEVRDIKYKPAAWSPRHTSPADE
jgi:hypothetical protein